MRRAAPPTSPPTHFSMSSTTPARRAPPLPVWWIVWAANALPLLTVALAIPSPARPTSPALRYLPLVPLLASSGLRWLVLPRITDGVRAFPLFVIGLALAEGAGILGLLLVPDLRATYVALGLLGVAQYAPTFARRLS